MIDLCTKMRYIRNINKLSANDFKHANCGEFGRVRCDCPADNPWSDHRIFTVVGSKVKTVSNGGNWTFHGLRRAILAAN